MRPCFKFTAKADAPVATLSILDEIGFWGVQAADFRAQLDKVTAPKITVEINSLGGDVFAAFAMLNMLRASGKEITTRVMGVAASAATIVLLAGSKREMPKNTMLMVHGAASGTQGRGTAEDHLKAAELLDKIGDGIVATYASVTGKDEDTVRALLAKDTWMTADEALENGFVTDITDEIKATASLDADRADLPENVKAIFAQAQKTPEQIAAEAAAAAIAAAADPDLAQKINDAVVAAGLPDHAASFAVACASMDEAQARIVSAKQIVSICALAKKPEAAAAFIKANTPVADARAELVKAMAAADENVITTPPTKSTPPSGSSGVNPSALWNSHRNATNRNRKD